MSLFDESPGSSAEQQQFDRLVDGELSEADRRSLLVQLEHQPDGWRHCALAFLEAQCWKAELGEMFTSVGSGAARTALVSQPGQIGRWQSWRQFAATTLTIAAGFLIAMVVLRGTWFGGPHHSPGSPVKSVIKQVPL